MATRNVVMSYPRTVVVIPTLSVDVPAVKELWVIGVVHGGMEIVGGESIGGGGMMREHGGWY
jgi:hypothetical protein